MRIWIDQDLCTGVGLCEDESAGLIALGDDGLAYLVVDGRPTPTPASIPVPAELEDAALDAADVCPEEAIVIEA